MNFFIVGLFISAMFLYEMASKKTAEKPEGPFSNKECNDLFNKLPPVQQNLIRSAIQTGSKDNLKILADGVRKDYPDMANCLDALSSSVAVKEGFNPSDIIAIPIPGLEEWVAKAAECKHVSGPGNKVYDCFFVRDLEQRGTGLVERLSPVEGRIVTIATYDSAYVDKHPLPEIGSKIKLIIPPGTPDC